MRQRSSTAGNNLGNLQSSSVRDGYGYNAWRRKVVPGDPETRLQSNCTADTIEQKLRRSRIMKEYLSNTLGLAAFTAAGVRPALTQGLQHSAARASRQMGLYRLSRWRKVLRCIAEWRTRARSRNELMNLSDKILLDIGVSRYDADLEASKMLWMS
jgi:uncharacterized protein YjiS (DUF1127 family)